MTPNAVVRYCPDANGMTYSVTATSAAGHTITLASGIDSSEKAHQAVIAINAVLAVVR